MSTPIGKFVENHRKYDRASLIIKGDVSDAANLFFIKYFELQDQTGKIVVVTQRALPQIGSHLSVKGKIEEAFSIGDKHLLVFMEE